MFHRRILSTTLLCGVVASSSVAAAAGTAPGGRSVAPMRIEAAMVPGATAIRLDGEFNEGAWERATPISDFIQRDPKEGAPPTFQTEARVLYDGACLYVAVRAFDKEPDKIVGIRTRRDSSSPSDWIRVIIDSYHDKRTAYEFAVNAAGVKKDNYWFRDTNQDDSWDAVWDVAVTKDGQGWKAEFRIPFSQLRFEPHKIDTFGFAVVREIGRLNEVSSWPLLPKSASGFVSSFGELGGLQLGTSLKRLELVPYAVANVQTQPVESGNPLKTSPDPGSAFGADLKYALTPGLTLNGTVNPDFGQVEADPAVVNLSAFETFYQERRPFFVESSGNLQFDLDCNDGSCTGLFYSRRIGRVPHGSPDVGENSFSSSPIQTTILGAAKLTGRAGAFSIGALNAVTGQEQAQLVTGLERTTQTVEPLTNYTVMQAKREWSNQSSLGFMFTGTMRKLSEDVAYLPGQALTGGVNWDWRLRDPRYGISGYWAASSVHGNADAIDTLQQNPVHYFQRPDAGYLALDESATSLNGQAGSIQLQKVGGEKVRFSFSGQFKTPGFDVNDVGYVRRADDISQSGWVQIRWDKPTKLYRRVRLNLNQWSAWNFGGDTRYVGANVNANVVLTSNWAAGGGVNVDRGGIDDRSTRGGPAFRSKLGGNVWYWVQTDSRKAVNGAWQGFVWGDESGSSSYGFDPEISYRPLSFLTVSGGVHFEKQNEDTQWVENVTGPTNTKYVFGRIRQTTVGLTARVNYTITPNLSVQLYAQPFVSAGEYSDYKELVNPRARPFSDQFQPYAYRGNPDFNYRSFRTTNVVRWEYRPGSALYVVWQQGREDVTDYGRFRFGKDMGGMFGIPGTNVFLVKFSYWLNM
ncbi:MAG: DUF5916 domain-containing protein [Acidobacteria bacterium]|nr:DUF5916 domain-containing protein [Acidobacteriota bacterium]